MQARTAGALFGGLILSCGLLSCIRSSSDTISGCCTNVSIRQVLEGQSQVTGTEHGEALVWARHENRSVGVTLADPEGNTRYLYSSDAGITWHPDNITHELNHPRRAPGPIAILSWEPDLMNSAVKYRTIYDRTRATPTFHERSEDGGRSWMRMRLLLAGCNTPVRIIRNHYLPDNPLTVYLQGDIPGANNRHGMFLSTDGGDSLTFLYETSSGGHLAICRARPNIMYGKGISKSLIKSTDGGRSWNLVGQNDDIRWTLVRMPKNGDPAQGYEILQWPTDISDIEVDPLDCNRVYAATTKGFLRSEDGGNSWCLLHTGIRYVNGVRSIEIVPDMPNILLLGTDKGLLRSTDRGCHWEKIDVFSRIAK